MQQLLNICAEYGRYFSLKFNDPIEYVNSMRYLGIYFTTGLTFRFSITEDLCKFYGAVNSVLTVLTKPTEDILLKLLYSNCVPILTYGAAVKDLTAKEKQQINVAVNNAIRRIFTFRRWESIRQLREFLFYESKQGGFVSP